MSCFEGHDEKKVIIDKLLVLKILINLIDNAIKSSRRGDNITVETKRFVV